MSQIEGALLVTVSVKSELKTTLVRTRVAIGTVQNFDFTSDLIQLVLQSHATVSSAVFHGHSFWPPAIQDLCQCVDSAPLSEHSL